MTSNIASTSLFKKRENLRSVLVSDAGFGNVRPKGRVGACAGDGRRHPGSTWFSKVVNDHPNIRQFFMMTFKKIILTHLALYESSFILEVLKIHIALIFSKKCNLKDTVSACLESCASKHNIKKNIISVDFSSLGNHLTWC